MAGSGLLVAASALAGSVVHTVTADWTKAGFGQTNIDTNGNNLDLTAVDTVIDDWYRAPWDDVSFEGEAQKDNGTLFAEGDRCLRDADNGAINGPTAILNGHQFRTGTDTTNISGTNYVSSITTGDLVPLPVDLGFVDSIRFLTGGARIASNSYSVRFHYSDATVTTVTVPIAIDTVTGAAREDAGTNYSIDDISVVHNANALWDANAAGGSDCAGGGGDDVIVDNPFPAKTVTDLEFAYSAFGSPTAGTGWLGGPLALSVITDEIDYGLTWDYRGEYLSPLSTSTAVTAGAHALWYELQWSASIPSGSEILVHVACGDDTNPANSTLDPAELSAERTFALSGLVSPFTVTPACVGRFLRYRVEIVDEFADAPRLDSITFVFDPDADLDGFGNDGNATADDCNDASATVNPSATEVTGNGIDENCDTDETCFDDGDNDNSRHPTNTRNSADTDCADANEGLVTDPIDCNDADPTRFVGATETVGDGIDQNCDGHDACFRDLDRDGHGTSTTVTAIGATCSASSQEATVSDDCDDGNAARFPGNTETVGDNVDGNCNDQEVCFVDGDHDGARDAVLTLNTSAGDHNCTQTGEGEAADPIDCDDSDVNVFPAHAEVTGNNKDDDCSGTASCFTDADNDGARLTTSFVTNPGDTDCNDAFEGETADTIDCNDADAGVKPGIAEVTGNGRDDNCDAVEDCFVDADNDGARTGTVDVGGTNNDPDCNDPNEGLASDAIDCNDGNGAINPAALELTGDNVDQNCDTRESCFTDGDNDGARLTSAVLPGVGDTNCTGANEGVTADPIDCNDGNAAIKPGVAEITGDGIDQNCDVAETCWDDNDNDNDRSGTITRASVDSDCADNNEALTGATVDCDDNDGQRFSTNIETVGNEKDNDCNGQELCNADNDNDNAKHPTNTVVSADQDCQDASEQVSGANVDCDDNDATAFPGNTETTGNGNDNDCINGEICFLDNDDDGFRSTATLASVDEDCTDAREGLAADGIDCDDNRSATHPGAVDTCGNGIDDNCNSVGDNGFPNFLDDDGDGLLFAVETSISTSDCDDDTDGDTVTDDDEHLLAHTSPTDADSDDDLRDDAIEIGGNPAAPLNTDGDGLIDALDPDDDNDGVTSAQEFGDPDGGDGDGVPNWFDDDSDGDNWGDDYEFTHLHAGLDEDGDGKPNYVDKDSDADTLQDKNELGNETTFVDSDGDSVENRLDLDDDGDCVATGDELGDPNPGLHDDFDGDGQDNYLDTDDDNDGEDSCAEDADGDGNPADDDSDGDGQDNYVDDDDDDDGILTQIENAQPGGRDFDGDGLANNIDPDSDDDGWDDADETSFGVLVSSDTDGSPDFVDPDSDGDLVPDALEGSSAAPRDTDGDTLDDRVDTDDDDDQIPTAEECSTSCADNQPSNDDFDGDTIADYVDDDDDNDDVLTFDEDVDGNGDPRNDNTDATYANPDTRLDYLDTDDDGDGLLTADEDPNLDGRPATDDTDRDGLPDYMDEDDDGDALFTFDETELHDDGAGSDDPRDYDFDGDGLPNYLDADDDGDHVDTICEITFGVSSHLVPDSDGDTFLDGDEWYNFIYLELVLEYGQPIDEADYLDANSGLTGDSCFNPWDRDSDGVLNVRDSDDDGDGLSSGADELGIDQDCLPGTAVPAGDGIPDYLDRDSDNDGIPDGLSGTGVEGLLDDDGDQIFDFLDCDDSGDAGDSDVDGIINADENTLCAGLTTLPPCGSCSCDPDIDDDGVIDSVEVGSDLTSPKDTDVDLVPDVFDPDDEADGRSSRVENGMDACVDVTGDGVVDVEGRYCYVVDGGGPPPDGVPCGAPAEEYWRFRCTDASGARVWFDYGSNELSGLPNSDAASVPPGPLPLHPDTLPDFLDTDDDGDGTPSADEGMDDDDGDGVPNALPTATA
ncbi:MAG: MopE-related protein [Myxococcota bacterium]